DPADPGTRVSAGVVHPTLASAPQPTQIMAEHFGAEAPGSAVEAHGVHSMAMPPPATMTVREPPRRKPIAAIFVAVGALAVVGALAFALGGDDAPKAASADDDGAANASRADDEDERDEGSSDDETDES